MMDILVGGIPTPLKNHGIRQLGILFPSEWKNKSHVPNHQPVIVFTTGFFRFFLRCLLGYPQLIIGPSSNGKSHHQPARVTNIQKGDL